MINCICTLSCTAWPTENLLLHFVYAKCLRVFLWCLVEVVRYFTVLVDAVVFTNEWSLGRVLASTMCGVVVHSFTRTLRFRVSHLHCSPPA